MGDSGVLSTKQLHGDTATTSGYQAMELSEFENNSESVSSNVIVLDNSNLESRLAQAILICQVCHKFSTYSFRSFQNHVKKHQSTTVSNEQRKLFRSGRTKRKSCIPNRKRRFRVHSHSVPHSETPNTSNNSATTTTNASSLRSKCPHCPYVDKYSNLGIHVKRKHTNLIQLKKFSCPKCSFSATSSHAFQAHLTNANHFERKCQICSSAFEDVPKYLDHLSQHFSGISVSKEGVGQTHEGVNKCGRSNSVATTVGSTLHDVLKEVASLEAHINSTNSSSLSRVKSKSLPCSSTGINGVLVASTSSFTDVGCTTSGAQNAVKLNLNLSSKDHDDNEQKMDLQPNDLNENSTIHSLQPDSSTSIVEEAFMSVDSSTCDTATQTICNESSSSNTTAIFKEELNSEDTVKTVAVVDNPVEQKQPSKDDKQKTSSVEEQTSSSSPKTTKVEEFTCSHCDITFRDKCLYTVHRGFHGFDDPFTCHFCGAKLCNKYAFAAHFHCS